MRLKRRLSLVLVLHLHRRVSQSWRAISEARDGRTSKLRATRHIALLLGRTGAFLVGLRRVRRLLHLFLHGVRLGQVNLPQLLVIILLTGSGNFIFGLLSVVLDKSVKVQRSRCLVENGNADSRRRNVRSLHVARTSGQRRQLRLLLWATKGASLSARHHVVRVQTQVQFCLQRFRLGALQCINLLLREVRCLLRLQMGRVKRGKFG